MQHHLAIICRPYLSKILDGSKTIEARLGLRQPCLPIVEGDLIWLKEVSGSVRGTALARRVEKYPNLTPIGMNSLQKRWNDSILAPQSYWIRKRKARWAMLIWLDMICPLQPFSICKRDRRAWVVLSRPPRPGERITYDRSDCH